MHTDINRKLYMGSLKFHNLLWYNVKHAFAENLQPTIISSETYAG